MDVIGLFVDQASASGLRFLLAGGQAVNLHGYQRNTLDYDFLISDSEIAAWRKILESNGLVLQFRNETFLLFMNADRSARVDLLQVDDGTFSRLAKRQVLIQQENRELPVASPLDIIALKLHALRQPSRDKAETDIADIIGLVRMFDLKESKALDRQLRLYADEMTAEKIRRKLSEDA